MLFTEQNISKSIQLKRLLVHNSQFVNRLRGLDYFQIHNQLLDVVDPTTSSWVTSTSYRLLVKIHSHGLMNGSKHQGKVFSRQQQIVAQHGEVDQFGVTGFLR